MDSAANVSRAIEGCRVLLGPYEPIPDFKLAIFDDGGYPIELIHTILTDEELWERRETENILYRS